MMSPMRKEYLQPQMMYAMPATQQMPVKTEMVKVPETKETKCETKVPVMPQSQMMCPAPVCLNLKCAKHKCNVAQCLYIMKLAAKSLNQLFAVCQKYTIITV